MVKVYERLINIQQYLFPGECLLCLDSAPSGQLLCPQCVAELPRNAVACSRCAKPLPTAAPVCGACQQHPPPLDFARTLYRYQSPVDRLIQQLKYDGRLYVARMLGERLRDAASEWLEQHGKPDLLLPVPLHRRRLRQRGFNQSIEITRLAARHHGIPLDYDSVWRIRKTDPQTELPLTKRKQNVRDAFEVRVRVKGLSVVLVDDVITSGHTVGELARILKRAGAREVGAWGIARA